MGYEPTTSGFPCWYELMTTDVDAASAFYSAVLGWNVVSAGMPDFDYRLASDPNGSSVAGLGGTEPGQPAAWIFYLEVAECDAAAAQVESLGGSILTAPADIPGTGRFAIATDPQGAVFGMLQPNPMEGEAPAIGAFDQPTTGHGSWHELRTSDPVAGFDFYRELVGWTPGVAMPMEDGDTYQIFAAKGTDIGAVQPLRDAPVPSWLSYFNVASVTAAIELIAAGGGEVTLGPIEVPGGAYIAIATDPQGAGFAVTGPLD
ncbi:VOC family protein [Microbacterium sediminicola]